MTSWRSRASTTGRSTTIASCRLRRNAMRRSSGFAARGDPVGVCEPAVCVRSLLKSGGGDPGGRITAAENMKQTVVPFRNAIIAFSIACGPGGELVGAEGLVIAAHTGDHTIYPDCREDFMQAMGDAMQLGTYANVQLLRPFIAKTKEPDRGGRGRGSGVDFARTLVLLQGRRGALRKVRHLRGAAGGVFGRAGLVDPTAVSRRRGPLPAGPRVENRLTAYRTRIGREFRIL